MSKFCPDCGYSNNDSVSNCVVCNFAFKVSPTPNSSASQGSSNSSAASSQSNTNPMGNPAAPNIGFYRTSDRVWSDGASATITVILMVVIFFVCSSLYSSYF